MAVQRPGLGAARTMGSAELVRLATVALDHGGLDWEAVAAKLRLRQTALQCLRSFRKLHAPGCVCVYVCLCVCACVFVSV